MGLVLQRRNGTEKNTLLVVLFFCARWKWELALVEEVELKQAGVSLWSTFGQNRLVFLCGPHSAKTGWCISVVHIQPKQAGVSLWSTFGQNKLVYLCGPHSAKTGWCISVVHIRPEQACVSLWSTFGQNRLVYLCGPHSARRGWCISVVHIRPKQAGVSLWSTFGQALVLRLLDRNQGWPALKKVHLVQHWWTSTLFGYSATRQLQFSHVFGSGSILITGSFVAMLAGKKPKPNKNNRRWWCMRWL